MVRYLLLGALFALGGCTDPERDPPQVYTEPSLVDLALATAGATRAQMGGLDHLAPLCARDACEIAPVTVAAASAGCAEAADRTSCMFANALRAYALQLFPPETAAVRLAEHLGYAPGPRSTNACTGDDPITCQYGHSDCAILPTGLLLYDTVLREVVVDLALLPYDPDFLTYAKVTVWEDRSIPRRVYLSCVADVGGRG